MNRLLLSSILATGLALGASGVFAADQYGNPGHVNRQAENYHQNANAGNNGIEGVQYTVNSGDTLSSIAEAELGSSDRWQEIARANNIENPDLIFAGQTLIIPSGQSGTSAAAPENGGKERASSESPSRQNEAYGKDTGSEPGEVMNEGRKDWESKDENGQSTDQSYRELKGEITDIGSEKDRFSLKDAQGMTHLFTKLEDDKMLDNFSVGDFVKIQIENGKVVSLEKSDRSA